MENPCCSCKLTRVWPSSGPWADDLEDMPLTYAYAFNKEGREFPIGQLQVGHGLQLQPLCIIPAAAVS